MTVAGDSEVLRFEFPDTEGAEFRVDQSRRQISGLVLPWGKVAYSQGFKWKFSRGSIRWGDPGRVKLLRDHDITKAVGKGLAFEDREDGLYGTFYVKRGTAGDEVLSEAEDGVLDGLSAHPMFDALDGWQRDPAAPDVRLVRDSWLAETTITAMPAFDDARVASVIAQRQGAGMGDKHEDGKGGGDGKVTVLENEDSGMVRFEAVLTERFEAMAGKMAEANEASAEAIGKAVSDAFTAAFARMADVDTTGRGEVAQARIKVISEPPVYRFNGDLVGPSLVRDQWKATVDHDHEARDRLIKFMQQQRDVLALASKAGVGFEVEKTTGTGVSAVVPPGYRPDLFVNELNQGRPIVAQASRGTITDATPFTVPRFVSAVGATLDHVEGINPASGNLTLDTTTVTPGAISGRFELTREIVDSSNPAIDAIALAAMRESYNKQTEQKAYAAINGDAVAPLVTNVTQAQLGGTPSDFVVAALRDLLAKYPFTRFAAPTGAVIGQPVTSNLANAKDTTNRPLLPSIGAQNTAGLGNAVQQGWFVDGLPHVPAWAITSNLGDDAAIIINRADFWAWESPLLTFRFEEKQGPAIIELALFSYFATHTLRPAGLAALREVA